MKPGNRTLLKVVGFVGFTLLTFVISIKILEERAEKDVSQQRVEQFPVVVVTPYGAEIDLIDSSKPYEFADHEFSFLVPPEKLKTVNEWLRNSQTKRGAKGVPEVRVEPVSDGKQIIELEIYSDGFFKSRYEATDRAVRPLTLKIAGPLWGIYPCGATVIVVTATFAILQFALWLRKRPKLP